MYAISTTGHEGSIGALNLRLYVIYLVCFSQNLFNFPPILVSSSPDPEPSRKSTRGTNGVTTAYHKQRLQ